jgi:phage-related protein
MNWRGPAWQIELYADAEGQAPVREFLRSLNAVQRRAIGRTIQLLEDNGPTLVEPHANHLQNGIWELRTQVEGDAFRCLYFTGPGQRFVILHVFAKKTQKTPERQIRTARRRREEWLARHRENP